MVFLTDGAPSPSLLLTPSVYHRMELHTNDWEVRVGEQPESWGGSSDPLYPILYERMTPVNRHSRLDEGGKC